MTLSWQQVLSHKYQYQYKYQYPKIVPKYRSSTSTSTQYNETVKLFGGNLVRSL